MTEPNLEFLAQQLARLLDEQAQLRDDIVVAMGRLDHLERVMTGRFGIIDETLSLLLSEVRALRRTDERLARRVNRLEDAPAGE